MTGPCPVCGEMIGMDSPKPGDVTICATCTATVECLDDGTPGHVAGHRRRILSAVNRQRTALIEVTAQSDRYLVCPSCAHWGDLICVQRCDVATTLYFDPRSAVREVSLLGETVVRWGTVDGFPGIVCERCDPAKPLAVPVGWTDRTAEGTDRLNNAVRAAHGIAPR